MSRVPYWLPPPPQGLWQTRGPPDIEAVVGVWGILCPLEQRPLKLDGDLGDRVGWQLNQHLQEVGLQPVLGRLVVDVTWRQARVKGQPYLFPEVRLSAPPAPPTEDLGSGSGRPEGRLWITGARQAQGRE